MDFLAMSDTLKLPVTITDENRALMDLYGEKYERFTEKYDDYYPGYEEKYINTMPQTPAAKLERQFIGRDSVYTQVLGLESDLMYDITKVRKLIRYSSHSIEEQLDIYRCVAENVSHPFLKAEVWRMFKEKLPQAGSGGYLLPPGKGRDIFTGIVDKFKGNLVLVDFWATTCGPCVDGIRQAKEKRKKFEEDGRLVYVFITDESGSPQAAYDKFVEENELKNTYRVTKDEWNYLMQLFKFSAIPRYVLLDKGGRVLDDHFSTSIENGLKKYE